MRETRVKSEGSLWPWLVAGVVLALALGVGAYLYFRETRPESRQVGTTAAFQPMTSYNGPRIAVTLYFPAKDGRDLMPEGREGREVHDRLGQMREGVGELIR